MMDFGEEELRHARAQHQHEQRRDHYEERRQRHQWQQAQQQQQQRYDDHHDPQQRRGGGSRAEEETAEGFEERLVEEIRTLERELEQAGREGRWLDLMEEQSALYQLQQLSRLIDEEQSRIKDSDFTRLYEDVEQAHRDVNVLEEEVERLQKTAGDQTQQFEQMLSLVTKLRVALSIDLAEKERTTSNMQRSIQEMGTKVASLQQPETPLVAEVMAQVASKWETLVQAEQQAAAKKLRAVEQEVNAKLREEVDHIANQVAARHEAGLRKLQQEMDAKVNDRKQWARRSDDLASEIQELSGDPAAAADQDDDEDEERSSVEGSAQAKKQELASVKATVEALWDVLQVPQSEVSEFLLSVEELVPFSPSLLQLYRREERRMGLG